MEGCKQTDLIALRHAAVDVLHEQRLLRGGERFNSFFHFVVGAAGQSPNDSEKQARQGRRARRLRGAMRCARGETKEWSGWGGRWSAAHDDGSRGLVQCVGVTGAKRRVDQTHGDGSIGAYCCLM